MHLFLYFLQHVTSPTLGFVSGFMQQPVSQWHKENVAPSATGTYYRLVRQHLKQNARFKK